jgi:hypothetical protein
MLILRQNSYVPRGKQRTGRREAQSREPVSKVKKKTLHLFYITSCRTRSRDVSLFAVVEYESARSENNPRFKQMAKCYL